MARRGEAGFTLIEALVALVILSLAATTLIGATESHIDRIRGLESRTVAQWVAENQLAEMRLAHNGPAVTRSATANMMGRDWRVRVVTTPTSDPALVEVEVTVSEPDSQSPLARLGGFLDAGAG